MFKKYIGTKAFYRETLLVALPIIGQQFISSIINLIDNFMVSNLGESAMSGVAVSNQIFFIYILAVMGSISGAGIYASQYFGAKDYDRLKQSFRFKILVSIAISLIAFTIVTLFDKQLVGLFLSEDKSFNSSISYMNIARFTMIPLALNFSISFTFRETGKPKYSVIAGTIAIFVNTILNYLLIFGNFGFPELGVRGAAIATVISRFVELTILLYLLLITKSEFRTKIKDLFTINRKLFKNITIKTIPLGLNELLWSGGMTALFYAYAQRGEVTIAAFSISNTISSIFYILFGGMSGAIAVLVGNRLGANKLEEAKDNSMKLLALGFATTIVLSTILFSVSGLIPKLYPVTLETQQLASNFTRVVSIFFPTFVLNVGFFFSIRAGGDTKSTLLMDSVFTWVLPIPIAFALAFLTDLPSIYMYMIVSSTDMIKLIIAYRLYIKGHWIKNLAEN